jgi:hypothetical protein
VLIFLVSRRKRKATTTIATLPTKKLKLEAKIPEDSALAIRHDIFLRSQNPVRILLKTFLANGSYVSFPILWSYGVEKRRIVLAVEPKMRRSGRRRGKRGERRRVRGRRRRRRGANFTLLQANLFRG